MKAADMLARLIETVSIVSNGERLDYDAIVARIFENAENVDSKGFLDHETLRDIVAVAVGMERNSSHVLNTDTTANGSAGLGVATADETAEYLHAQEIKAAVMKYIRNNGGSFDYSNNILGIGFGRFQEVKTALNGQIGSDVVTAKEIRIKSDGAGAVSLYNNSARNGRVNRIRTTQVTVFKAELNGTRRQAAKVREIYNAEQKMREMGPLEEIKYTNPIDDEF